MSSIQTSELDTLSTNANILIPVSSDKSALLWDGNPATILGLLFEVKRYYKRKGLFQTLFTHRAAPVSVGRQAVC